jgi:hypothetical protein
MRYYGEVFADFSNAQIVRCDDTSIWDRMRLGLYLFACSIATIRVIPNNAPNATDSDGTTNRMRSNFTVCAVLFIPLEGRLCQSSCGSSLETGPLGRDRLV